VGNKLSPIISVVLTSYNYARLLPRAIEAALDQSLQPDELIIIDDASTDNSLEIIREYARVNPIIKLVENERNEGVICALNRGLKMTRGRYIVYASADDLVLSGLFEQSVELLTRYPRAAFSTALVDAIDENGMGRRQWPVPNVVDRGFVSPEKALWLLKRYGFWFVGGTAVFRREALNRIGGFPQDLGPLCDSFISQVLALRHGFCFIPEPLAQVQLRESSYSKSLNTDAESSLEIMRNASGLMRTVYNDVFPDNFVDQWESVWLLFHGFNAWRSKVTWQQRLFIEKSLPMFRPRLLWLDRVFVSLLRLSFYAQTILFFLYFFISFGRRLLFNRYFYFSFRRGWKWIKQYLAG